MITYYKVYLSSFFYPISIYHYNGEEILTLGQIVKVNFRGKVLNAVIMEQTIAPVFPTKEIILTEFSFSPQYMEFIKECSYYSLTSAGNFLNCNYFSKQKFIFRKKNYNFNHIKLTMVQLEAKEKMKDGINLLFGVTGSGKTEIGFNIIQDILQKNNEAQILILMPEIALTESISNRFEEIFNFRPVLWNSKNKSKKDFMSIYYGKESVVIGSRSAIFLPFKNLHFIMMDEEQDSSYKQITFPSYGARDFAIIRSKYII